MDNLNIYNKVRVVPSNAMKAIGGGRLKGMTDINPMWRIKVLTEQFGPCGIGWKYTIEKQWLEEGSNSQKAAFVNISLYIKLNEQWSEAIPGTGGSMFVTKEKSDLYTSDECFKMALTDAISVACKALGVGADVYWDKDKTKYDQKPQEENNPNQSPPKQSPSNQKSEDAANVACKGCGTKITAKVANFSTQKFRKPLCMNCQKKEG